MIVFFRLRSVWLLVRHCADNGGYRDHIHCSYGPIPGPFVFAGRSLWPIGWPFFGRCRSYTRLESVRGCADGRLRWTSAAGLQPVGSIFQNLAGSLFCSFVSLSYVILPAQTFSSKLCFHSVFSIVQVNLIRPAGRPSGRFACNSGDIHLFIPRR